MGFWETAALRRPSSAPGAITGWARSAGSKPGVTLDQARGESVAVAASLADVQPAWKRDWSVALDPLAGLLVGESLKRSIPVAFGAVLLVLLLASANIANLMLAKGVARRKEMAHPRRDSGPDGAGSIAQVLTESLVLCLIGATAGIGLAYLMIQAATPLLAPTLPATASLSLDLRVLGFAGRGRDCRLAHRRRASGAADVVAGASATPPA